MERRKKDRARGCSNILLLGCDAAEDINTEHDATEKEKWMRSDVMLVISLNHSSGRFRLLILERDVWVNIPGHGMDRLNAAVVYGGPELAMKVINDAFRLNVSKYVMINMSNMAELVDSLGGIDMYLTDEDAAYIDDWISEARRVTDKWKTKVTPLKTGGFRHLNGLQALQHARNRDSGSRETRVKNVLKAMIHKVKKDYNFLGITVIAARSLKYVKTNIGIPEGLRLLYHGRKIKLKELETYSVPGEGTYQIRRDGSWRLEVDFEKATEEMWDFLSFRENGSADSPLVEYVNLSPNHSGRRTHGIDRITPHCTGKQVTADELGSWFSQGSAKVSSNYGIDRNGRVGLYVMEKNCSWCSSDPENDQRAVTIECASDESDPCRMNDAVYRTLIRLCADICRRNGKRKLLWLCDKEKTLNYDPAPDEMLITVHRWFSEKNCPGDWLYSRLGDLAEKVTESFAAPREPLTPERRAKQLVSRMSAEEKIGQILLLDFRCWLTAEEEKNGEKRAKAVTVLNDEIRRIIRDYHCGNIILFDENCADTKSLCRLTYDLQQAAASGGDLPLLIGIDQEGGDMTRLAAGTCLSGNGALGLSGEPANAYLSGQVIGSELKAVGINCDFSPAADVIGESENPAVGTRSFSGDAKLVARMASAMSEGLLSQGVISCAKHFPGHGAAEGDSHSRLPLISATRKEWSRQEALPFQNLARNGIPMIMTGHLQFPAMDRTRYEFPKKGETIYLPASLSKRIITGILKRKLGFQGVVVTDSLKMDAISNYFTPCIAAVMALAAGADMLCMPVTLRCASDVTELETLYAAIKRAMEQGVISSERLDDAAARVLTMKIRAGILDADHRYDVKAAAEAADAFVGGPENRAIERRLADACVKLVYNGKFEAFGTNDEKKTVFFMPYKEAYYSVLHAVNCMEKAGKRLNVEVFCYQDLEDATPEMIACLKTADNLVVGSAELPGATGEEKARTIAMPQKILSQAAAKHAAIICIGLSGQAKYFDDRYPKFLLANCGGMAAEDVGHEKFRYKYSPAIPAAVYRIFGGNDLL